MPQNHYHPSETAEPHLNGHTLRFSSSQVEIRSEEVQDIMNRIPHWMIRRGTIVLLAVMMLLFIGAYFIHYPDVIITSVTISSTNPPVKIVAQSSGKIQQIFVQNNTLVKKEQSICLLENSADYRDIKLLKKIVSTLDTALDLTRVLRTIPFNQFAQLGELQGGYADLYQAIHQYLFFIERNFANQKLEHLQSQIGYQSQLSKELQNKDILVNQQLMLEKKKYSADSSLVVDKVIAPLEFDNSKKELINKQINADAMKASILQNKLQQTEYLKVITDLQQQKLQQDNDLQQKIRESVKHLQGQLDAWEQKYLVKSPLEGKAVFFKFWKENQYARSGETILLIVPPVQSYVAKALLPIHGSGKVKVGQKVLIKLSSYPFEEFGMITGKVGMVSTVALDTAYSMEIQLLNGLKTNLNKQIFPQPQLQGFAEILTEDKNVFERLF